MTGEYQGKDGRARRWFENRGEYALMVEREGNWCMTDIPSADWPAARAALDALIEEEAGEWVRLSISERISTDGSRTQTISCDGKPQRWLNVNDESVQRCYPKSVAYRKGREVALEEAAKAIRTLNRNNEAVTDLLIETHERDMAQVQELVEAVLEYVDNPRIMSGPQRRLRNLAKAVKL